MASNQAQLSFAIRAVNEANAALKSVGADLTSVEKAASSADKAAGGFGSALGGVAKIAGGFVLAKGLLEVPGALMSASDRARDLELQMKKATTVFGDQMPIVQEWASKNAAAMGMSKAQVTNLAAGLQDLLVPMGFTREEATKLSTKTLGLAGALSEWSGGAKSASEVSDILTKAYLGETDGLKALGISISAADVAQRLHEKGQDKLTGAALQQAQALAIQEMAFEKSTDAQTAFANGAGSAARKQAEMKAKIEELKDSLATNLAPAIALVTTKLADVIPVAIDFASKVGEKAKALVVPAMEAVGDVITGRVVPGALAVVGVFREKVIPVLQEVGRVIGGALLATWRDNLLPAFEEGRKVFEALAPHIQSIATNMGQLADAVADKLSGPFMAVFGFLSEHREDLKIFGIALAIAVPIVWALAAAHAAQATAATAAAAAEGLALLPILAIAVAVAALIAGVALLIRHWDDITAKYPALGAATDALKAKFQEFVGWITGTFVPGVLAVYTGVKDAVDAAVGYVRDHWDDIKAIIEPALQALVIIIQTQVALWQTAIETVLGVIKGLVDVFMGVFTGDWDRAWGGVKQIVESVWNGIKESISTAITGIKNLAPLMKEAGEALLGALWDGMKGVGGKLEEVIESIGKGIANGVIAVLNAAIQSINDHIPDKIALTGLPDIDLPDNPIPTIPALAAGGIVMRPTLALIGEAGPEAVIPLGKGGGVGGVTVVIQGSVYGVDDLMYQMDRALKRAGQQGLVA